ncbi:BrnA antitoxin family protein [Trinickia dinghuensis]|uniref:Antitoxin n=1 Tax=Trinickia dinghuensis TaxID=2291023 RepID=A0A3D8K5X1_9BURK|nr:BrnA antitoxin family protein [Trinickia dinghuensis]RDU99951.1 antitoxin [Trinickia dinghuensis]
MSKRKVNEPADDNPAWSEAEFTRARPAEAVLPELFGQPAAEQMLKRRGRPKSADAKIALKLRIDPDVVAAYRAQGAGWQTRINDALRDYAKSHGLL